MGNGRCCLGHRAQAIRGDSKKRRLWHIAINGRLEFNKNNKNNKNNTDNKLLLALLLVLC